MLNFVITGDERMQALQSLNSSSRKQSSAVLLHNEAMEVARKYRRCEADLLQVLTRVEQKQIYLSFEITCLRDYCVEMLGLSRHTANNFIDVMRTSLEVPALAEAIYSGRTTISKARKICSVLTPDNAREWIDLAIHCSCRVVEKAVAMANPRAGVQESLKYVSGDVLDLRLAVSEEWAQLLEKTKDRLSQKNRRAVSTEEALMIVMSESHLRNDPLKKAERAMSRSKRNVRESNSARQEPRFTEEEPRLKEDGSRLEEEQVESTETEPPLDVKATRLNIGKAPPVDDRTATRVLNRNVITSRYRPASIRHQVNLRDENRCAYVNAQGTRCLNRRWLDHHHIKAFAVGGTHEIDNLETLCRAHHRIRYC